MKSLAQKLPEKMRFSQIIMYVTICDLHGHRRSQVMVRNESLYMSSYLMNNCNYRPVSHRYWDIDMQHFCNHGYIFERRFSPISL